ncbi:cleft lip and palate transmembrane protein 1 homolog [Anneissia japonica]|uniref:cleft lip and palate transmembrane protein 1 homolog n=1 Tax=Anneissia japonica TaxID=1529436 RepID=UPI0014255592|nr:cleft lip and palate transmembrane protein 1 homolog [Anneissia japonica]
MADANGSEGSPVVANNQNEQQPNQQQRPQSTWDIIKGVAFRMLIFYFVMSFFRGSSNTNEPATSKDGVAPVSTDVAKTAFNLFPQGTIMDMRIYISEDEEFTKFNENKYLYWELLDVEYGDWYAGPTGDSTFVHSQEFEISENVINNGSIYIHVYFTKSGYSPDPSRKGKYAKKYTVYQRKQLNKFKKRSFQKTRNLLTGETDASEEMIKRAEEEGPVEILSHWHPNLTINIIDDHTPWKAGSIPQPLDEYIKFHPSGNYYPVIYINDYWNMMSDYQPINETTPKLTLVVTFYPLSLLKWQFYAAQGMKSQWSMLLGDEGLESEGDQDSFKRAMLDTNPYLLGLTVIVSIVHSVFEFLAFKNDIQFWNNRKSLEGLSVRSVFFGVFQSLIVLLYILDNETNFVIKVSIFIGLLIDCWKITKVVTFKIDPDRTVLGFLPRITIEDKSTYVESATKQYDQMAFKYLSWLLFPLLACYAVYSLFYQEHKGWYSWVLSMLYGFLLTFGFIMMTPQLFINYKLKSIAHLPWRMLTYKALNTFIDDIFAFVIQMPTLYRIGCLRDDVIFLIYVYQRWIYPIDYSRVNEFGTTGEMHGANGNTPKEIEGADATSNEVKPEAIKSAEEKKKD